MSFVVRWLLGVAVAASPSLAQAQSAPAPSRTPAPVRVFMRNEGGPLTFSARAESAHAEPTTCISPCDAHLLPGEYQLKLNGVAVDDTVELHRPGTLHGEYHSRAGTRSGAWLALNIGGIIGGV